jgi:cold shock CspA family protein
MKERDAMKWLEGCGFIQRETGEDALLHHNAIQKSRFGSLNGAKSSSLVVKNSPQALPNRKCGENLVQLSMRLPAQVGMKESVFDEHPIPGF